MACLALLSIVDSRLLINTICHNRAKPVLLIYTPTTGNYPIFKRSSFPNHAVPASGTKVWKQIIGVLDVYELRERAASLAAEPGADAAGAIII
jgi:hypothetical protein